MLQRNAYHRGSGAADGVEVGPCPWSRDENFPDLAVRHAVGDVVSLPVEEQLFNRGFPAIGESAARTESYNG